jgi:acyl-CoA synthetase (AMP-forming)/AMP-acid ligase II
VSSGAAPLSPEVIRAFRKKGSANLDFREGYAMTECPVIVRVEKGKSIPGSVGKLSFNLRAKFLNLETGEPVGPGNEGEICIKGACRCHRHNLLLGSRNLSSPRSIVHETLTSLTPQQARR